MAVSKTKKRIASMEAQKERLRRAKSMAELRSVWERDAGDRSELPEVFKIQLTNLKDYLKVGFSQRANGKKETA